MSVLPIEGIGCIMALGIPIPTGPAAMIRTTSASETDVLAELAEGTGVFKPLEIEALREVLDDYHAGNHHIGHRALTLEQDGEPVGFAYYAPTAMTDRAWHLYWIFVRKTGQSRG